MHSFDWDLAEDFTALPEGERFSEENVGPNKNVVDGITLVDVVDMFWDTPLLEILLKELDLAIFRIIGPMKYSASKRTYPLKKYHWYGWLAIWIEMGITQLSSFQDYWKEDSKVIKEVFTEVLARDVWMNINRSLWHISDEVFFTIEEELQNNFRKYWNPAQRVAIDETMRRFYGRSKHKVYAPDKQNKRGLKV